MIGTIIQRDLHVNDGVTCEDTALHSALDTLVDRLDEFLRNRTARNSVDELITLTGFVGFENDFDMTVLTGTAGLPLVLALVVDLLANGLLVGNLRVTDIGFHLELAEQTVNDDLQMMVCPVSSSV